MEQDIKVVVLAAVFITCVGISEVFFFADTIFEPLLDAPPEEAVGAWWSKVPILAQIGHFLGWMETGLGIMANIISFNVGHGMPLMVRVIILIPLWVSIAYIMMPLLAKIIQGVGNLILFT